MIGSKNSQNSEQFMTRSGSHSTKPSVKGYGLLGEGKINPVELLTPEESRASLLAARLAIEWRIRVFNETLRDEKLSHSQKMAIGGQRRLLKEELKDIILQQQSIVNTIRSEVPRNTDLSRFIADVVKERMSVPQWKIILAEAERRYAVHEASLHGNQS